MTAYRKDPDVLLAEPNYIRRATEAPNDPHYDLQWALENEVAARPVTDSRRLGCGHEIS